MSDDITNARQAGQEHRASLVGALMGQPVEPESARVENINVPSGFDGGGRVRDGGNITPVEPTPSTGEQWAAILRGEA